MINSLLKLGASFKKLNKFIEKKVDSIFVKSMKEVVVEILEKYESRLVESEQRLLKNQFTPFVYLKHSLFDVIFPKF
jgi:predicted component of type VI protein secretion system